MYKIDSVLLMIDEIEYLMFMEIVHEVHGTPFIKHLYKISEKSLIWENELKTLN